MSFNTFPELNYDDITWPDNNSIYGDDFGFNGPTWDQSNAAGLDQPYTGADVFGDYNNYPEFPSPSAAPVSLYPTYGVLPEEGKPDRTSWWLRFEDSPFDHRVSIPILPGLGHALIPPATG